MTPDEELPESKRETWDVDALWSRVRARTLDAARDPAGRPVAALPVREAREVRKESWVPRRARAWAAAGMLLAIAGTLALFVRPGPRSSHPAAEPVPGHYGTSRGQFATIRLIDGSEVTLAPESRLTVSGRFAGGVRELSLDGEAIFSVKHDALHPFKVSAGGALIEDAGTRFDLRAYPGDSSVTVAVVEGSVTLSRGRADSAAATATAKGVSKIFLDSGEVGTLDERGGISVERTSRVAGYLDWASGRLSFVDRPLPEVLRTVGRWYDLDVRVSDPRLARRLVNAELSRQSAAGMIDALALAMDATVERHGRVVTLRPR
ncbi:MAG: FecR family protein [Gemmatimonadales bacterium]